ncbi:hypothetical protein C8R45DRAFT_322307 [Mycena sanguinolenta]|nr:hypothetical protein C8R45DRAFT_322307 [Mycena sanguinolenta]
MRPVRTFFHEAHTATELEPTTFSSSCISIPMPTAFRGPRQGKEGKTVNIFGGTGGNGGGGGVNGGSGGFGEGSRVKIGTARTVTNFVKYTSAPTVRSGFRKVPLGDIDLQREIHWDRRRGVASLRKLHSAKISVDRESLDVTVAVYQGAGAKQEWRRDVKNYMTVRHPNFVQLYGTATYGNIHAAVFHDDLIPLPHFEDRYRHAHFSSVYIKVYARIEFDTVHNYFWTTFQHFLSEYSCTFLIRRSTGQLCLDLVPRSRSLLGNLSHGSMPTQQGLKFLEGEDSEAAAIDSFSLELYHTISYWQLSVFRSRSISSSVTVNLASVYNFPSDNKVDDVVEIAWLPNTELSSYPRWYGPGNVSSFIKLLADGWTRLKSNDVVDTKVRVEFFMSDDRFWLSQANHIFTTLQISSDFQHYVVSDRVRFGLTISTSEVDIPMGFLFLCPLKDFRNGKSSLKWPDCPAYWSLDPSGVERLAPEEAINLGFPTLRLSTNIRGFSWDASMYTGLRQFHQAKGFDPNSQDVARHLGHKLYQVSICWHILMKSVLTTPTMGPAYTLQMSFGVALNQPLRHMQRDQSVSYPGRL